MQRSLLLFEGAIKTEATRKHYLYYLRKFLEWAKIKDLDGLLQLKDSYLQQMIEDYLFYQKKRVSPNSIVPRFAALELFFAMNDKPLNFKKIRKMFPGLVKKSGDNAWTTQHIQKMLRHTKDNRNRSLILFISSTGCRIGAIRDLKIKHLVEMPEGCKAVKFYEDSPEEYWSFLTPEASKSLDEYLNQRKNDGENLKLDSPLFRTKYKFGITPAKPISNQALNHIIRRIVLDSDLPRERKGQRFNIQQNHGFRKRFNTILKLNPNINPNIAEKLMGHKRGNDGTYLVPTREESFREFAKAIADLTIDDNDRLRIENKKLQTELSEKQRLEDEIKRQGQSIDFLLKKEKERERRNS